MFQPELLQSFLAVLFITISCSLLGVFVLWKKLSYFGDALSHSVLLGLTLGVMFEVAELSALLVFAFAFALLVGVAVKSQIFSRDIIILTSSYLCIAIALIVSDIWLKNFRFEEYVFGDFRDIKSFEVQSLAVVTIAVIYYVFFSFKRILLINLNSDLAKIENIKTDFWNISFMILLALTIAVSIRIVGVFLMTALLILPAALARIFSRSAKEMLFISVTLGALISAISFKVAIVYDLTISSTIIAIFSVIFFIALSFKSFLIRN